MSFHIDIVFSREVLLDGTPLREFGWLEKDYSLDDCVRLGWYDPATDTWVRKEVVVEPFYFDDWGDFVEEAVHRDGSVRCPDGRCGKKLGLKPVLHNGRWVHDAGAFYMR